MGNKRKRRYGGSKSKDMAAKRFAAEKAENIAGHSGAESHKKQKQDLQNAIRLTGTLSKHRRGFGFVTPLPDAETAELSGDAAVSAIPEGDIFVPAADIGSAMDGDVVEIGLVERSPYGRRFGGHVRGVVIRVIRRKLTEVVGSLECSSKFGFVVPESKKITEDIFVEKQNFGGARRGDKVVAVITRYPEKGRNAEGKITEIIARAGEPGGDIAALIRAYGLSEKFPQAVLEEARALAANQPGALEKAGESTRRDLRAKRIITIDGADSKDFDDAVSIDVLKNGNYLLGVHIADVSHYVREDSPLDKEAAKRGNSVYLLNKVVPMLPAELSNGICSLNPGEDRLTLSVDMEFTPEGELVNHEIYESIIRSAARMVYTDVSDMLEYSQPELLEKYAFIYPDLLKMAELAKILKRKREEKGSLDFDIAEAYIKLDDDGKAAEIGIAERRSANKLIEEFMLAANETIAEHFYWMELPFIYRVHEKPDNDRIEEFRAFAAGFGLSVKGSADNIHPRTLAALLKNVEGKTYENVINTVLLRSMKKAFYDTECLGHFGLGFKYYCHFTSPIRRYPDLMIHRIIKESIAGRLTEAETARFRERTEVSAAESSATERKAQELEREVEKLKKAEYMEKRIGECFEGVVSGVTAYGMYVQLENTVEGLVRLESLEDDYYSYEPEKYRLIGRLSRKTYNLGDIVDVEVEAVDLYRKEIDFRLA